MGVYDKVCVFATVHRPGKYRQNAKLLAGKFCDLEGKNKEIYKGNLPYWREILASLQGNEHFFPGLTVQIFQVLKTQFDF